MKKPGVKVSGLILPSFKAVKVGAERICVEVLIFTFCLPEESASHHMVVYFFIILKLKKRLRVKSFGLGREK